MHFNEIQLPADYIALMYKDTLVAIEQPNRNNLQNNIENNNTQQPKSPEDVIKQKAETINTNNHAPSIPYLGENKKKVIIMVRDETATFIREEWLQFLSNILLACKLNIGDVAIINQFNNNHDFKTLHAALQPKYCIIFLANWQSLDLPFVIPTYQIQTFNQCKFLTATPIQQYLSNDTITKEEKRKLWLSLKSLFNLN